MAAKVKISVTVGADILRQVDRTAAADGSTRSATIESWLRSSALRAAEADIEAATIAYYQSMTPEELADDRAIARGTTRAAKAIRHDDPKPVYDVKSTARGRSSRAGESTIEVRRVVSSSARGRRR